MGHRPYRDIPQRLAVYPGTQSRTGSATLLKCWAFRRAAAGVSPDIQNYAAG